MMTEYNGEEETKKKKKKMDAKLHCCPSLTHISLTGPLVVCALFLLHQRQHPTLPPLSHTLRCPILLNFLLHRRETKNGEQHHKKENCKNHHYHPLILYHLSRFSEKREKRSKIIL